MHRATQRGVIAPSFHRLTLRVKWAINPLRFSIGLVVRSVRYSAPVMPSACTVSVSSEPSRMLAAAPGCLACSDATSRCNCIFAVWAFSPFQASRMARPTLACSSWGSCSITLRRLCSHERKLQRAQQDTGQRTFVERRILTRHHRAPLASSRPADSRVRPVKRSKVTRLLK